MILKYDKMLSSFAFNSNVRRYGMEVFGHADIFEDFKDGDDLRRLRLAGRCRLNR